MDGELAQLVAVVAHGNAYLSGRVPAPELAHSNSTFKYVESVRFVRPSGAGSIDRAPLATATAAWFEALGSLGAERIWLVIPRIPNRRFAAFANAGPAAMLVCARDSAELWTASWSVISPRPKRTGLSRVLYESSPSSSSGVFAVSSSKLAGATEELRGAIRESVALARAEDRLSQFGEWLRKADELLDAAEPKAPYHPDLLPAVGYPIASRRLLAACVRAWVFGGMGSWNDVGFDDEDLEAEYERISERLWQALLGGVVSATNAFDAVR
jgi:hypothetical protein